MITIGAKVESEADTDKIGAEGIEFFCEFLLTHPPGDILISNLHFYGCNSAPLILVVWGRLLPR